MNQSIKNPAKSANSCGVTNASKHLNFNPVEAILQRLENVKKEGKGFRALCPACGGTARKLTIVEGDDALSATAKAVFTVKEAAKRGLSKTSAR
mgnify:CR=1 FL=1